MLGAGEFKLGDEDLFHRSNISARHAHSVGNWGDEFGGDGRGITFLRGSC